MGIVDESQLKAFAEEHIGYEVAMLTGTCALLARTRPGIEHNALLESFLIHARAIDDFLSCDPPDSSGLHGDDVVAQHYAAGWHSDALLPKSERRYVNKLVAHLTTVRLDKEPVKIAAAMDALVRGFQRFLMALSPERRSWFVGAEQALTGYAADAVVSTTSGTSSDTVDIRKVGHKP